MTKYIIAFIYGYSILQHMRLYNHEAAIEAKRANMRKYYHSHKEKFTELRMKWLANNPSAIIADRDLSCIRMALKSRSERSRKAITLLGCSIAQFAFHLESRWLPGMTWENYGSGWVMDHIKPRSSFNMLSWCQRLECFNYLNTRPLWKQDNQIKYTFPLGYIRPIKPAQRRGRIPKLKPKSLQPPRKKSATRKCSPSYARFLDRKRRLAQAGR